MTQLKCWKKFQELPDREEVMKNIQVVAKTVIKQKFKTIRRDENIAFKIGHIKCDSDKRF